jgi:hypothetical protein
MTVDEFRAWLDDNDVPGDTQLWLPDDRGGYPMDYPLLYRFGAANPPEVHLS